MLIQDLVRRALLKDSEKVDALVTASTSVTTDGEEDDQDGIDYKRLVDPVVDSEEDVHELPEVSEDYFDKVKRQAEDLSGSALFVVPPFQAYRDLPPDIQHDVKERCGTGADLAEATMLCILEAVSQGTRLGFFLPTSFVSSSRSHVVRKNALKFAHPELFIEDGRRTGFKTISAAVQVATVLFSKIEHGIDEEPVSRFFEIPKLPDPKDSDEVFEDFDHMLQQGGGETEYGYVIRGQLDPQEPWTVASYDPEIERELTELEALGEVISLGDMFDISRGVRTDGRKPKSEKLGEAEPPSNELQVVDATHIRRDGTIVIEDTMTVSLPKKEEQQSIKTLRNGDICVRQHVSASHGVVAGRVEKNHSSVTVSSRVLLLRPKERTTLEDSEVVLQYLQSERASRYLRSKHIGGMRGDDRLLKSSLRDLPVPRADNDLKSALRSLIEAAEKHNTWKEEALDGARSLFDRHSAKDGKMHILETGRRSRQRQRAAERQDDLSYRVQTQFPHPVAYRWRTVAAAKPDLEGYLHVLECAEVTLSYLAFVAIAMSRSAGEDIGYLKPLRNSVAGGKGIGLGDWIAILREVRDNKTFRKLPDTTPFYEVMRFMPDGSDADEVVSRLQNLRNDQAHGRGPRGDAVPDKFDEAKEALLVLLEAAEFISEYPLRYIDRTQADTLEETITYWYRDVMGDHPLVPVEHETRDAQTIEAGSLYLVERSEELHLLRPFLDRRRCPECGTWSTFLLDSFDADEHSCRLKSMEHSHTTKDGEIRRAFEQVGLLPSTV